MCIRDRSTGTKLIYYSLYKNISVFLAQVWFSIYSGYSAQTLYDDWVMTFYNVILTSLPVYLMGVFEKDLVEELLMKYPSAYRSLKKLKSVTLLQWLVYTVYHSLALFFLTYWMYDDFILSNGKLSGLRVFGNVVMSIGIILVSLKLAIETNTWNMLIHTGLWGSILFYFLLIAVQSYFESWFPSQAGIISVVLTEPLFYLVLVIVVVVCLLPDLTFKYLYRQYRPKKWRLIQEKDKFFGRVNLPSETLLSRMSSDYGTHKM
eukprot:TRINITY_DN17519_c0_g1_i1.p1 TRINITY_DN17519_c0_g1~~TRINITY_DN17519_c0_g1_i1.p1  ORF type:complete len:262 (+),score=18.48 TRINITY_DN17519_c0_g1_i1:3-788(+)